MGQALEIQKALFQKIKEKLPQNVSFVHEIAELLEISYDSAYRRIRGEKDLSFAELSKISQHFGISVDTLFNVQSENVVFKAHHLVPGKFTIKDWLGTILTDMKGISLSREKEIIYAAKDPPVFHYFQFPEVAAFKVFFWEKTLFQFPEYEQKKLRLDDLDKDIWSLGQQIASISAKIPTIEIWNEDTFNITLRQIEYYYISGYFEKKDDIFNLIDKVTKWIQHIQKQAELGFKFLSGGSPDGIENNFKLYENEVVLNDNTIYVKLDDLTAVYLTFNVLCLLITRDPDFCQKIELYLRGLIKQSNLISLTGAKERNRFFNRLLHTIEQFRNRIDS
jgi:hypothetical protein